MDNNKIAFQRIIDTIDGNVQSKNIKVKFSAWMVIGSKEWEETSDETKAHAYQAALALGWTKESLIKTVCAVYDHIDPHMAKFTVSLLEELSETHTLQIEKIKKEKPKVVIFGKNR